MKKIMFNDKYGLTQAVLEGRKTQTRRIVSEGTLRKAMKAVEICGGTIEQRIEEQTPYCFSEEVAIAQSYDDIYMEKNAPCPIPEEYRLNAYNKGFNQGHNGWKNKMYVSADDMPFRINITNIRIERLQDISEEDCFKEGIEHDCAEGASLNWVDCEDRDARRELLNHKMDGREGTFYRETPQQAYASLIDHISGKGTWDSNPYVFVYDFELVN